MDQITRKGYKQLKDELAHLTQEKRWEIAGWLKEASSQGDMDENAEYIEAKEAQDRLEARIEELGERLRNVHVVSPPRTSDVVQVGSRVDLTTATKSVRFLLVGAEGANVAAGEISTESPLGKAVIGRKVGEHIEVYTPSGIKRYNVAKIV